jgi:sortase A
MRLFRTPGSRRIATWAERSLWALGLLLLGYWGWSQAAIRFEQARLEESLFGERVEGAAAESDALTADLASASAPSAPVLAPGTPLALIEIPRVELRAMVVEGVDDEALKRAAGHLPGTALPGGLGNSVIAAHRDTLFAGLRHVRIGDLVTMRTGDRDFSYRVSAIDVVTPRSLHVLDPTPHATLTMITCFPFDFVGPAPMRYIVSATEVSALAALESQQAAAAPGVASAVQASSGRDTPARPLDPRVLSFISGSLVKPGAN